MKVKYIGETYDDLTHGKIYECIGQKYSSYKIIDDSNEDYYYPKEEFEIVEND